MQEPILFNQTIKENILYGNPNASDSDIRRVCEQANALQFIESNFESLDKEKRAFVALENFQVRLGNHKERFPNLMELHVYNDNDDYV